MGVVIRENKDLIELSVIVVVGAAGVLSAKAATGVRDRLAGEFVVGGCGLRGAVLVGEESELWSCHGGNITKKNKQIC